MSSFQPEEFDERIESVPPFNIRITTYRLGPMYYYKVDTVDLGAVITRSAGVTREFAESKAVFLAASD